MQEQLSVAILGCGYWGPNLVRNFKSLPACRVRRVCDLDQGRLEHMKELHPGLETCSVADQVFMDSETDAVVIATPTSSHYDLAKRSLLAGKHTMVEKPMARSTAECSELIHLASEQKLTLMVGHTFLYSPAVRKIKDLVDWGDLGEILYVSSRRLNLGLFQEDINVVWDLAPHDISIILYLLGESPVAVNCQGKAHVTSGVADVANLSLDFSNGEFASIQCSWLNPSKTREMIIVGSKRMIVYDDTEPLMKIKIYDERVETPPRYDTFAEFQYSYHYGDMYAPYLQQVEPLKVQCQHFLDCIGSGSNPDSSGYDGLRVVQILEASSASLEHGGSRIEVPPHKEAQHEHLTEAGASRQDHPKGREMYPIGASRFPRGKSTHPAAAVGEPGS